MLCEKMQKLSGMVLGVVALLLAAVLPAQAQQTAGDVAAAGSAQVDSARIVADLSTHTIAIRTDFAGTRVLMFGALVRTAEEQKAKPGIIVVIRGPEKRFRIHRKVRKLGIWVNSDERIFEGAPGYYAILATHPIQEIAPAAALKKAGIGFDVLQEELVRRGEGFAGEQEAREYAAALIRLQQQRKLYQENDHGVRMTGRYLFRAQFDLPANVPLGTYHAQVYLFRNGRLLGRYESPLTIEKRGFEQFVYDLAHQRPLIYGIAAVIIAIAAGFAADAAFRKS